MIITRTPLRASFLGGGSDHRLSIEKFGGLVVGSAVDKYSFLSVRRLLPFHGYKSRLVYSQIETVKTNSDIEHGAIRECVRFMGMHEEGLEVFHACDLPGRSGTGSSSTFVVGLLHALAGLKHRLMMPQELARGAIEIEQERLGECVGSQDQYFSAFGGLQILRFRKDGDVTVTPFAISSEHVREFEDHLLLFFTGIQRTSSEVASSYVPSLPNREREQREMIHLAEEGIGAIYGKKWETLGKLMDRSWRIKASLSSKVCNNDISRMYASARVGGAFGGKITGAGSGGCLLVVAPPDRRRRVIDLLEKEGCLHIPFRFDFGGSRIIYADHEQ